MNEEIRNEDEGVSLGEICHWIWLKKFWLLGLTFGITLLIGIVFIFGINPGKAKYNVTFSYDDVRNLNNGSYLDGTKFDYHNVISEKSIREVVESNKKYEGINIEELTKDSDFNISKEVLRAKENDLSSEIIATTYSIDVPARYFSNKNIAGDFFYDLINLPLQYNEKSLDLFKFDLNLDNAKKAKTFNSELAYFESQIEEIRSRYQSLINEFGDIMVYFSNQGEDGVSVSNARISNLLSSFEFAVQSLDLVSLKNDLAVNLYVKDYDYVIKPIDNQLILIDKNIKKIDTQVKTLETELESLKQNSTNIGVSQAIAEVINKISTLKSQKYDLEVKKEELTNTKNDYNAEESKAFAAKLDTVLKELEEETEVFKSAFKYVNINDQLVQFKYANIVKKSGTASIIIVVGIGLVLGLCVGALTSGILGYNQEKRNTKQIVKEEN